MTPKRLNAWARKILKDRTGRSVERAIEIVPMKKRAGLRRRAAATSLKNVLLHPTHPQYKRAIVEEIAAFMFPR
jgi:hypothetical protein